MPNPRATAVLGSPAAARIRSSSAWPGGDGGFAAGAGAAGLGEGDAFQLPFADQGAFEAGEDAQHRQQQMPPSGILGAEDQPFSGKPGVDAPAGQPLMLNVAEHAGQLEQVRHRPNPGTIDNRAS